MLAPGLLEGVGAEEDRDPAIADLGGHLDRLAADRADEDRDLVAERVEVELQRLALAGAPLDRQLVVLSVMLERPLAGDDLADDLDVFACPPPRLRVGNAVPALRDLRAGGAEAEHEAASGERVQGRPGHRRSRRRPRRDLHDRRAELDPLGLRGQPAEHGDDVGAVALGDPDGVEPVRLRRPDEVDRLLALRPDSPIAEVDVQFRCHGGAAYSDRRRLAIRAILDVQADRRKR